jgi:hypothetical protein
MLSKQEQGFALHTRCRCPLVLDSHRMRRLRTPGTQNGARVKARYPVSLGTPVLWYYADIISTDHFQREHWNLSS